MKKLLFIFSVAFVSFLSSCQKEEDNSTLPAKDITQALARITAVSKWKIQEVTRDGVLEYKDGISYNNADNTGLGEWITFNSSNNSGQVKYLDETVPEDFTYIIDTQTQTLVVKSPDGFEDFMTIESGSVYEDHFDLSITDSQVTVKAKFVPF